MLLIKILKEDHQKLLGNIIKNMDDHKAYEYDRAMAWLLNLEETLVEFQA